MKSDERSQFLSSLFFLVAEVSGLRSTKALANIIKLLAAEAGDLHYYYYAACGGGRRPPLLLLCYLRRRSETSATKTTIKGTSL